MGLTRGNDWRISSKCDANSCVQVGWSVRVRDSKDPLGPQLNFSRAQWLTFTTALQNREAV